VPSVSKDLAGLGKMAAFMGGHFAYGVYERGGL
jgi:hypothetical protein